KTPLLFLAFLFSFPLAYSQTTPQQTEQIATFCQVWGFLKYYHPVVAKGGLDWDAEFMTRVKTLPTGKSKQEISNYYLDWIDHLGKVKDCASCTSNVPESLAYNLDLAWLSDSTVFTPNLINQFRYIQRNRNRGKNQYVQQYKAVGNTNYDQEKPYVDSIFPSPELRLLALSRYWNIINYFFPYKYRTDQPWNMVLPEMIPKFKDAPDTIAYHLAMLELTVKTNDYHAVFVTHYTNQYFGSKWAPFRFKLIDNKAIVTGFYDDSLCLLNDIQKGDVFLTVNNKTIEELIKTQSRYIGASNEAARLRNAFMAIFNGQTDSVNTTFEREGKVFNKTVYRYFFKQFTPPSPAKDNQDPSQILEGNIGYVNLGLLQPNQVDEVLEQMKHTRAIIFDVRNYPKGTMYKIADFLNAAERPFVKFSKPDMDYPGVFQYTDIMSCGHHNEHPYPGKVVLLFNERTQSHAEFTLMALQTAPRVISIGSQTAGADGNVSEIVFPGNYKVHMTGIGVYYPDGRETQRIGIVPDITVKPTIAGLQAGKDEVLAKALEYLENLERP
ncbi:MAG: S41 family peptidase, partial [Saprospiraceae bacterium]